MDEMQQQVIEQLPTDGSAITFDEWKSRVATHVGAGAVMRTANKFNRGQVNYQLVQGDGGDVVLMVSRVGEG
jgi:predicted regulator of Ras-like GTPase activity (Roadblock/LC7/MglB family)